VLGDDAREHVRRPARCEDHQHVDRAGGEVLRARGRAGEEKHRRGGGDKAFHGVTSRWIAGFVGVTYCETLFGNAHQG
jgi:hypothetical protein